MAEDVVFKVSVQGKSLGELKKEFADINKELSNAKVGTQEYQKTLEKLGNVKDEIGDLRNTINALNPEGKVAAFQNVAGKLAGGFQAATGAAALFGSKSEELEKQLLKVQAATAFAQGIQSIVGLSDAFAVLKATLMSLNPWLVGITVAVVAIAGAYKLWSDNMSEAAKNDAILNAELERQLIIQNQINEGINRQLEIIRITAKKQSEVYSAEREAEIIRYGQLKARLIILNQLSDKTDEQLKEIKDVEKASIDSFQKIQVFRIKSEHAIADEEKKQDDEARIRREKRAAEEKALSEKRILDMQSFLQKRAEDEESFNQASVVADQKAAEEATAKAAELIAEQRRIEQIEYDYDAEQTSIRVKADLDAKKEAAEEEKRIAQEVADAKVQLTDTSLQSMRALSDIYFAIELGKAQKGSAEELKLRKKQFEVTKAFNLAAAVIDGIRSVQSAYLSGLAVPIIGPATGAAYAVLSGIVAAANIAKIASAKFEGGGSVTPTIPSGNPTVPTINTASQTQPGTRLNPDGTPQTGSQPVQAYVLEKELTDAQKRSGRIQKQGKF